MIEGPESTEEFEKVGADLERMWAWALKPETRVISNFPVYQL